MILIEEMAAEIYGMTGCAAVRHKLIRSGLVAGLPQCEITAAERGALESKWVRRLEAEQLADGSWGRFHSQDSSVKNRTCPTSETAAWRLRGLGIGREAPIAGRLCEYMERLISDLSLWPDAWERNKRFRPAVPLFIASKISIFGSKTPAYLQARDVWLSVLEAAFADGGYSREREDARARELLGTEIYDSYIGLNGINNILLFSNCVGIIPPATQKAYLRWLHASQNPVPYTLYTPAKPPQSAADGMNGFLSVLGLLSGFEGFAEEFAPELEWLAGLRGSDGLWDFGIKTDICRLSDAWRAAINRRIDHSVCALEIIKPLPFEACPS